MSQRAQEATVAENLEPLKPKDLGINDVEFYEVEQTPPVGFFGAMKGFWVTFSTIFKKPLTVAYPEVKAPTEERFHGRYQLNRHADGLEKFIGCEPCAWACPVDAIYVEG